MTADDYFWRPRVFMGNGASSIEHMKYNQGDPNCPHYLARAPYLYNPGCYNAPPNLRFNNHILTNLGVVFGPFIFIFGGLWSLARFMR